MILQIIGFSVLASLFDITCAKSLIDFLIVFNDADSIGSDFRRTHCNFYIYSSNLCIDSCFFAYTSEFILWKVIPSCNIINFIIILFNMLSLTSGFLLVECCGWTEDCLISIFIIDIKLLLILSKKLFILIETFVLYFEQSTFQQLQHIPSFVLVIFLSTIYVLQYSHRSSFGKKHSSIINVNNSIIPNFTNCLYIHLETYKDGGVNNFFSIYVFGVKLYIVFSNNAFGGIVYFDWLKCILILNLKFDLFNDNSTYLIYWFQFNKYLISYIFGKKSVLIYIFG